MRDMKIIDKAIDSTVHAQGRNHNTVLESNRLGCDGSKQFRCGISDRSRETTDSGILVGSNRGDSGGDHLRMIEMLLYDMNNEKSDALYIGSLLYLP